MPIPEPESSFQAAAGAFELLGDPDRLAVLLALADRPRTAAEVCRSVGQAGSSVGRRLHVFRVSGLVGSWREGKRAFYGLTARGEAAVKMVGDLSPRS